MEMNQVKARARGLRKPDCKSQCLVAVFGCVLAYQYGVVHRALRIYPTGDVSHAKSRHPLLASLFGVLSASVWALGSQFRVRPYARYPASNPLRCMTGWLTRYLVNDTQFVCSVHSECMVKLNRFYPGYYESICISNTATKVIPI